MSVSVRLRPLDLMGGVEWQTFTDADGYTIADDNTLEVWQLRKDKTRVIGHVHRDRWDAVRINDSADAASS